MTGSDAPPIDTRCTEHRKPLVLLIDDELENRKVLTHLLSRNNQVLSADSYTNAIDIIDDLSADQEIQVIVCDKQMPGTDGLQTLNRLSLLLPDAIRIMLCGIGCDLSTLPADKRIGLFALLTKPIDPPQLLQTVKQAGEAWQRRLELKAQTQRLSIEIQEISEQLAQKKLALGRVHDELTQVGINLGGLAEGDQ